MKKSIKLKKLCPFCKKSFETYPSQNLKTCSTNCAHEFQKNKTQQRKLKQCLVCNKKFVPMHTKIKGLYCSHKCFGVSRRKKIINRNGYNYIYLPSHPNARKQGYYPEHRHIVEQVIGRNLTEKEIVHHKNHIKNDNRLDNLMIMSPSGHKSFHAKKFKRKNGRFSSAK